MYIWNSDKNENAYWLWEEEARVDGTGAWFRIGVGVDGTGAWFGVGVGVGCWDGAVAFLGWGRFGGSIFTEPGENIPRPSENTRVC